MNQGIIENALAAGKGEFSYDFRNAYEFQPLLYAFGGATVSGEFTGDARREGDFLVISGVMDYRFTDRFEDPFEMIEGLRKISGFSREEAITLIEQWGIDPDILGTPYIITDRWSTKINGTVKINK